MSNCCCVNFLGGRGFGGWSLIVSILCECVSVCSCKSILLGPFYWVQYVYDCAVWVCCTLLSGVVHLGECLCVCRLVCTGPQPFYRAQSVFIFVSVYAILTFVRSLDILLNQVQESSVRGHSWVPCHWTCDCAPLCTGGESGCWELQHCHHGSAASTGKCGDTSSL